jgi:hypothetical protein
MAALDAELAARIEGARRFEPIPLPLRGQCLRDSVACCLGVEPWQLPLRWSGEQPRDWADAVCDKFACTIELARIDELPPPGGELWVGMVAADHVIPMRGATPVHLHDRQDYSMASVHGGLLVRPA